MIYVFAFLGEFGYELLNWQGVVRKFSRGIERNDKVVIASRKGLSILYETADLYVDISELEYFKNSIATGYGSNCPNIKLYSDYDKYCNKRFFNGTYSIKNYSYNKALKRQIISYVEPKIEEIFGKNQTIKYVFSDKCTYLGGLQFGRKHRDKRNIYDKLNVENNEYIKLNAKEELVEIIQSQLNFSLHDDYVLCQMGSRSIVQRSKDFAEPEEIINLIAKKMKVVLLEFSTGRNNDSGSQFKDVLNCIRYKCSSLEEQSVLMAYASSCLFFTEGDFRSHNYLPPFFGKDVYSVAPSTVYQLPTTPIDFWNKNVFTFGGQIIQIFSEQLLDINYSKDFAEKILANRKD
ncbi:hypothetical protein [Oribacterium sp. FC2011]|uniref:hypothetical protein n=1 Tax=Oribacterium sp. FC2011 TaxID=1408311 RepID=UPI0004E0BE6B|nr:hypothetical protein [Oribacterium sp. FC2011]